MSTDDTTPAPSAKLPCAPTNGGLAGTEDAQSRHAALLARIAQAALAAGRDPSTVQLLAVSKTFGPDAILALAACAHLRYEPAAASVYGTTPYLQDNSFLIIGERLNASGSKKVRELLSKP